MSISTLPIANLSHGGGSSALPPADRRKSLLRAKGQIGFTNTGVCNIIEQKTELQEVTT